MPDRDAVNATLLYHGNISGRMTAERTALESALIPVTAYILVSGVECYRRYPELMGAIAAAKPPAEIGAAGKRPGNQVDAVHLWSIANIALVGRQILAPFGLIDPVTDLATLDAIFGFWEPAAAAFRGDGHLQAWDAGFIVPRYGPDVIAELLAGTAPIADDASRATLSKLNAALTSFLFLLYFDTRAGYQDTGPYPLPDGRTLLVRDFNEMGVSHFPWSASVCAGLPHANLTVALVLEGVDVQVNDWGTTVTDPVDYMPHVVAAGFFDSTGGTLTPIPVAELDDLRASVKRAQKDLYRLIAGMTRAEKIDAGAYVYFTFLRPFARIAGVEDDLDWTVPRDSMDLYEGLSMIDKLPDGPVPDPDVPYYTPLP
ncbi:MAG: hypothetical protein ACXVKN_09670 [Acidimicrobiia bacterium]